MAEDTTTAPPDDATQPADAPADDGKLKQTVEITDVGPCKKHVKITVDRDAIDERFKEKVDELLKKKEQEILSF